MCFGGVTRFALACLCAGRYRLLLAPAAWALLTSQTMAQVSTPASAPEPALPSVVAPALAPVPARAALVTPAQVQQPRAYGYTVGDLLQQRIALGSAAAPFVPAELPRIGRIGSSLWRRRVVQQVDTGGRHWLLIEYQLINTPQSLTLWYLPKLLLKSADGSASLLVPNAPFSVAPFTPPQPFEDAALPALQSEALPAPVNLAPLERRMRAASGALLLVLAAWATLLSWRHLRRGRHLPFACAVRDMRMLQRQPAEVGGPLALQRRLHHALNATAGEVVRAATLSQLLQKAPHLAQERGAIEVFLRMSHAAFFGGHAAADPIAVTALAQRLRRLEHRHAE